METLQGLIQKIEEYGFECEGGPLRNCVQWQSLKALAASPPQGEPVAWRRWENEMWIYYETNAWPDCIPLYAHPPTAPQAMNPLKMIGGEHPASCVCFICKPPELKAAPQVEGLEQFETIRRLATTLDGTVCYQGDVLRHEAIALYRQYVRECDQAAARIAQLQQDNERAAKAYAEACVHMVGLLTDMGLSDCGFGTPADWYRKAKDKLAQEQAAREAAEKDAARYRFIKDDSRGRFVERLAYRDGEHWDADIDAEIAALAAVGRTK